MSLGSDYIAYAKKRWYFPRITGENHSTFGFFWEGVVLECVCAGTASGAFHHVKSAFIQVSHGGTCWLNW